MAPKKGGNIFQRILQLVLDKDSVEKTKRDTQKGLKDATDPKGAEGNLGRLGKAFDKLKIIALGLATALVAGLALALRKVIGESIEAQKVAAQQEAVLKSTGEAAGRTSKQLQTQANALQRLTTFTDEQVASAQNLLLTFRNLREKELDKAVELTLDMATAMGTDATSAALQLGKALDNPIQGLTALRRAGVSFSQAQQDVIKNLVETGKRAEAQRMILAELEVQFGGSAEAARNTLGGALEGLKNAWGEVFEVSRDGSDGLIRSINAIAAAIEPLAGIVEKSFSKLFEFWDWWEARRKENAFSTRLENAVGGRAGGGMGDVRIAEGADDQENRRRAAAQERERLRLLEEQRLANEEIAKAEKERRDAEAKAQEARIRAQEEFFELLVMARNAGVATAAEERQLQIVSEALFATANDVNTALKERVRISRMLENANKGLLRDVRDRDPKKALAAGREPLPRRIAGGLIADPGQPIVAPDIKPQTDAATKTKDAWLEALQEVGIEAQITSGLIEAAFSSDGFLRGLARIAGAKAKENLARAIETAAGGLAALVFGDPTKLAPAAKATAGFLAAAAAWGALGAGGGGGGAGGFGGGGGGFTPSAPPGRAVDRMPTSSTTVFVYIDPFDKNNSVHQQTVGEAVNLWVQRQSPTRRR